MTVRIASFAVLAFAGVALAADVVTYEQFGAKGDGVTDDLPAIVAAHEAANKRCLSVRAKDDAVYYIGGRDLTAKIMTDTDFGTAKFVIDDRAVTNCRAFVFSVLPTRPSSRLDAKTIRPLVRGGTSLGVTLPGRALVKVENAHRRQYRRTGNANMTNDGEPQRELLIVNADGSLDPKTEIVQDMPEITYVRMFPIDAVRLTVSGGRFRTIANREIAPLWRKWSAYQRGISVTRSNVLLTGLEHEVVDQIDGISPYCGFVNICEAAEVTVSNSVFFAHRKTSHGTYDLDANMVVDMRFVNCREATDIHDSRNFFAFGSNYCRDILLDGCTFGRFDAHCGCHNATIRNSRLVQVNAVGTGTFLIENTRIEGPWAFAWFRSDYGSNLDGDFIVRNCVYAPSSSGGTCSFISAKNDGSHDYGYPCRMARHIVIDGLRIEDVVGGKTRPCTLFDKEPVEEPEPSPFPYLPPDEISIRNLTTASGTRPKLTNSPKFLEKTGICGYRSGKGE